MKKIILTISIIFLLVSLASMSSYATYEIIGGNNTVLTGNVNKNNTNSNTNNTNTNNTNRNTNNNIVSKNNNTTNKVNTTNKNSSYKNTNLPDTGSEDFVIGFVIVAGVISAIYAYIKIKTYNI